MPTFPLTTASMWSTSPVSPQLSMRETSAADPPHLGCYTDRTPTPDPRCCRTDFDLMCPILISYQATPHVQPPCSLRRSILPLAGHPRSLAQLPCIVGPWASEYIHERRYGFILLQSNSDPTSHSSWPHAAIVLFISMPVSTSHSDSFSPSPAKCQRDPADSDGG